MLSKMITQSFFDPFFWGVSLLVASLAFADFLLGKQGRKAMRERVAAWWVYLDDATYAGLGADDARRISTWLRAHLGPVMSVRFVLLASLAMSVCFVLSALVVFSLYEDSFSDPGELIRTILSLIAEGHTVFVPINVLVSITSLAITLGFLKLMAQSTSLARLVLLSLCDVVAIVLICIATVITVQSHRTWDTFDFGNVFDQLFWLSVGLNAVAPIGLHMLVSMLFMITKLIGPLIQRPVSLILLRVEESEKGVLTIGAVGMAAVSKMAQELLKLV
jgi:hypothetical protein